MMNILCINSILNYLVKLTIVLVVLFVVVQLAKTEGGRKVLTALVVFLLICSGIVSGIWLFKKVNSESYINGSLNSTRLESISNVYYATTDLEFYQSIDDNLYHADITLLKTEDFNGEEKQYEVSLNGYIMRDVIVTLGSINFDFTVNFKDVDGSLACTATMHTEILYLNDKTTITMTVADAQSATYLKQYFNDHGLKLFVYEVTNER